LITNTNYTAVIGTDTTLLFHIAENSCAAATKVVFSAVTASNMHRKSDVVQISIKYSPTAIVTITQQSDPPLIQSINLSVSNKSNNNRTTTTAATDKVKGSSSGS
jgi:hypothetical protein